MTITTDVLAYGVPADIQPPAPGETIEQAEYDAVDGRLMRAAIFIAVGAVVVAVVAVVVLAMRRGRGSLAEAAENMRDQNVRMELEMGFSEDGEDVSMSGTALSTADGTRMRMDVTVTQDGESTDMTIADDP